LAIYGQPVILFFFLSMTNYSKKYKNNATNCKINENICVYLAISL